MKGGTSSAERLVKDTKRGLLITRFHYTNILDPLKTVLTGMTRDGTFLIEDGEVVGPVRNLRYTENVLEALGRIDGASRRLTLARGGPCVVPTLRHARRAVYRHDRVLIRSRLAAHLDGRIYREGLSR